jgi:hypothetical protein
MPGGPVSRRVSQKRNRNSPMRTATTLNPKLTKVLGGYIAAAAASAGVLALAEPANAEVVYTPTNTPILINTPLALDLNNDGTTDFVISNKYMHHFSSGCTGGDCTYHATLKVSPAQTGNAGWGFSSTVRPARGGMRKKGNGAKIDVPIPAPWGVYAVAPERKFIATDLVMDSYRHRHRGGQSSSSTGQSVGPWGKGKRYSGPYLALRFMIGGEVHYGWARVEVHAKGHKITATLTGYAYETTPNVGIVTGLTHEPSYPSAEIAPAAPAQTPVVQPAMLGLMAQGSAGLSAWRGTQSNPQNVVTAAIR